ncbi:MAG TPA: hypothetical protein VM124_00995 [Candidatus Limnocylindrales bacterium]|nr:hypothetical protein [Candidatus Limnocylindrales bacterium]
MTETLSERRMAKNEAIFREANRRLPENLDKLKQAAVAEGQETLLPDIDIPLHFYCECSDENCRKRIVMKPSEHKALHQNTSQFVIIPGHNVPNIERVMRTTDEYTVIEKYNTPPPAVGKLRATQVDNA